MYWSASFLARSGNSSSLLDPATSIRTLSPPSPLSSLGTPAARNKTGWGVNCGLIPHPIRPRSPRGYSVAEADKGRSKHEPRSDRPEPLIDRVSSGRLDHLDRPRLDLHPAHLLRGCWFVAADDTLPSVVPVPIRRDSGSLGKDQPSANCVAHQARRFVDVELLHDARPVEIRGPYADLHDGGDLLRGLSLGHEPQRLLLPAREVETLCAARRLEGRDDRVGDAGTQVDAAAHDLLDRPEEIFGGLCLDDEPPDAIPQSLQHVMVRAVHREQDDADLGAHPRQLMSCGDPVQGGHDDVENGYLRLELAGQFHGGATVRR